MESEVMDSSKYRRLKRASRRRVCNKKTKTPVIAICDDYRSSCVDSFKRKNETIIMMLKGTTREHKVVPLT
jgi:hypothetical protein